MSATKEVCAPAVITPFDEFSRCPSLALEEAAAVLDLEPWILDRLRHPDEVSTSYLQILRDCGDAICVPLFRVRHSQLFDRSIGSLSLRPDLQVRTAEAIAMERTWQASLLGLPLTGASYGLVCDSNELSERELLRLLACAARRLSSAGVNRAIIFPGGGCHRECVAKLYADIPDRQRVALAGKPDCLGGFDLDAFKAEGIAAIITAALREQRKSPNTARVAVQGFGALGQAVCQRLAQEGMTLAGLSDHSGALYRADGLIVRDIVAHYRREPMLFDYSEAEHVSRAELPQSTCDVLVLTDGTNEIQERIAGTVRAGLVVEAHWNAVTASARQHLEEKGVKVVPWVLATSAGLLGACFESGETTTRNLSDLLSKTRIQIGELYNTIHRYSVANNLSLDQAARVLAVERVANGLRLCH